MSAAFRLDRAQARSRRAALSQRRLGTASMAVWSLVLGLLGVLGFVTAFTFELWGFRYALVVVDLVGFLLGRRARTRIAMSKGQLTGDALATTGEILGVTQMALVVLLLAISL
jgi:hypothetical protein